MTAWDKLAKKELFDNLRYPLDAVYAEDSPVTYQLLDKADRIVYDSTPLYRYRMSENSQSHGITDKPALHWRTARMRLSRFAQALHCSQEESVDPSSTSMISNRS